MANPGEPTAGGGTNARALGESVAETGPGLPDEAIGPEQLSLSEERELADSPEGRRIEQKLRAEALARRGGGDETMDPTGHA